MSVADERAGGYQWATSMKIVASIVRQSRSCSALGELQVAITFSMRAAFRSQMWGLPEWFIERP